MNIAHYRQTDELTQADKLWLAQKVDELAAAKKRFSKLQFEIRQAMSALNNVQTAIRNWYEDNDHGFESISIVTDEKAYLISIFDEGTIDSVTILDLKPDDLKSELDAITQDGNLSDYPTE